MQRGKKITGTTGTVPTTQSRRSGTLSVMKTEHWAHEIEQLRRRQRRPTGPDPDRWLHALGLHPEHAAHRSEKAPVAGSPTPSADGLPARAPDLRYPQGQWITL